MSPKSRPPKEPKAVKGSRRRRGRKKAEEEYTTVVIEEESSGPPFGIIVLAATVMSIPSIMQFIDGRMEFDSTVLRFLAALAVAWILVHLVHAVAHSFHEQATTIERDDAGPGGTERYRMMPGADYSSGFTPTIDQDGASVDPSGNP